MNMRPPRLSIKLPGRGEHWHAALGIAKCRRAHEIKRRLARWNKRHGKKSKVLECILNAGFEPNEVAYAVWCYAYTYGRCDAFDDITALAKRAQKIGE